MSEKCPACGTGWLSTDEDRAASMCTNCREWTGLSAPRWHARRPALPCVRCSKTVFVRVLPRTRLDNTDQGVPAAPLVLTYQRNRKYPSPDVTAPAGLLEAWVCRSCGFVEWYCGDAENIPIGLVHGTELVDVAGEGPYR